MKMRNIPRVKMVIGMVRTINMGFTMAFRNAITAATTSAVQKFSTETPGII